MPTISMFRGIRITMYYNDHMPPHFHASYAGEEALVSINDIELIQGGFPNKQLKMLLNHSKAKRTDG